MTHSASVLHHRGDYRPFPYRMLRVTLHILLDAETTRVRSRLEVMASTDGGTELPPLRLDGRDLDILSLAIDGHPLPRPQWRLDSQGVTLVPPGTGPFVVESECLIHPAANTALEGLYQSGNLLCTQCEAEGFRKITLYPDRPDVMSVFDVTLEGDARRYPVMLCNGNPGAVEPLPGNRQRVRWQDPFPKPSYLFALVAGDLQRLEDHFITASGRRVTLWLFSEAQNIHRCGHAMASLKLAMAWDESRFGREYDLDLFMIVAVGDFNMGAMENKGLNI
ncbi:MAG: aminopeptidase N, partial [Magnetococcus sp. WYHC-3]